MTCNPSHGAGKTVLADAWCKVRAMNQANMDFPDVKLFIYMDSDAVVDKAYVNVSIVSKVAEVQQLLQVNSLVYLSTQLIIRS